MTAPLQVSVGRSVATRLLRVVFSVYLLFVVGTTLAHLLFEYQHQKRSIDTDFHHIRNTFAHVLAAEIWKLDEETVRSTVQGMVELPTVVGVRIHDAEGKIIATGGLVTEGDRSGQVGFHVDLSGCAPEEVAVHEGEEYGWEMFEHRFPISYPRAEGDVALGHVTLYSNTSEILRRVKVAYLSWGVVAVVQIAALWCIFLWFSNHILRRPLTALADTARSVTLENLDTVQVEVDPERRDELAGLGESFNAMIANLRDSIAEQTLTAQALRESEAKYRTLIENVDLGITMISTDYRVLASNPAQGRLFAKTGAALVGLTCFEEFGERTSVCPDCPGELAMRTRRSAERESEGVRTDGTPFHVHVHAYPVVEGDEVTGFVEVVEDITERRRVAREKERLEEQLRHAQKLESLGVLAGGIAHDFNNLLVAILGNADLALTEMPPHVAQRAYLEGIRTASQRAAELTNQMLAYSGKGRFVVRALDLNAVVEEMGHLLAVSIPKKVELRYDLDRELPAVDADAAQIHQVVMNLVTNAASAIGEESGVIRITTATIEADREELTSTYLNEELTPGRYVSLEVSDSGCGMDDATQARLFDPFFTTKAAGRGLGMAAVLGIVRGHHGAIRVRSEPGRGSTFTILLPASEAPAAAIESPAPDAATVDRGGTILVVDDEEGVRTMAEKMLRHGGYEVLTAHDGIRALEVYREHRARIRAVLLDLTMPRMNGEETLRELRRIDAEVKVVISSGYEERDATQRLSGEDLAFIQKPYPVADLLTKIRAVLASRP